jgi:hypothetical protein
MVAMIVDRQAVHEVGLDVICTLKDSLVLFVKVIFIGYVIWRRVMACRWNPR